MKFSRCTIAVFVLLSPAWAFAQFQLDIEQVALVSNQVEEVEEKNPQPQNNHNWMAAQNIDGWIFNQHGDAKTAKRYMENQLKAKLASLSSEFELNDNQTQKLLLAGTGDIKDFFAAVEVIRDEFKDEQDQNKINEVYQRVQPLQMKLQRGIFSGSSILAKVSIRTLDEEQRAKYEENEKKRFAAAYRSAIKMTISELEKSMPFTAVQRKEIVAILEDTPPPRNFGQYVPYYVLFQLSKEQKQVEEILGPGQAKAMKQAFQQGQQMAQFLRQNGFIE